MKHQELICDFGILRELRKRENMSIAELSEQSGVSASVISKLERNQNTAEMDLSLIHISETSSLVGSEMCIRDRDTLYRIARVFGLTLSDLISLAENKTSHCVEAERYKSGDFDFDRVNYGNMRCMHASAKKGAKLSSPELHRDDYELCWVLKGRLRFSLPNESYELTRGMSIQFDALLPHTYETLEETEIIIVHLRKGKRF